MNTSNTQGKNPLVSSNFSNLTTMTASEKKWLKVALDNLEQSNPTATTTENEGSTMGVDTPQQDLNELQKVQQEMGITEADQQVIKQIQDFASNLAGNDPVRASNLLQAAATEGYVTS